MEQGLILVPALTSQNATSTLLVRVTRVWESVNRATKQVFHTNVALVDQEGNQIVATVRNTQKANCFPLIAEGKVYRISDVKVMNAPTKFRAVDQDKAIVFYHKTKIVPTTDTNIIPMYKFDLTTFENAANLVNAVHALIDVIGMLTDYGNPEKASNGAIKMDIVLVNERAKKMTVTLWEAKAEQFQAALTGTGDVPVFAVVTGLLAKKFADNVTLSSSDATKTYLNIDYKPLNELKEALAAATGKSIDLLPPPAHQQFVAANAQSLQQLLIQQILSYKLPPGQKLARCMCVARITEIVESEGWCYTCCPTCGHTIRMHGQSFHCGNCTEIVPDPSQRYRLIVRVEDPSATTTFTLFNKEVERLILVPIANVIHQHEGNPPTDIPEVLNNVIGKTCSFHIKITGYNTNFGYEEYTVVKLYEHEPAQDGPVAAPNGAAPPNGPVAAPPNATVAAPNGAAPDEFAAEEENTA